ncbi:putative leucine-rich repeat receptor-like protein kinase-like [Capsicum annuum]|nr:putative leucine-rich repeat receptor-like protein kinase-like [Capsicum annuum]
MGAPLRAILKQLVTRTVPPNLGKPIALVHRPNKSFFHVPQGTPLASIVIAVKQLSSKSKQGNREFINEISMISSLHHPNLVKLYGCCAEGNQLLLVFRRTSAQNRLDNMAKIWIGIAKGLAFLHKESSLKIVHRDIKATNILLDKKLNPKISYFGLDRVVGTIGGGVIPMVNLVVGSGEIYGDDDKSLVTMRQWWHIVKALLKFWDPTRVVFKFKDFELAPIIEEIGGFTNLKYQGWGILVFPLEHGRIDTCLSSVVRDLFRRVKNAEVTLVLMIVVEMMRALSKCTRGRRPNKIDSHLQVMAEFIALVGTNDWYAFMRVLTGNQIQWRYPWLSPHVAVIKGRTTYYIELIGLKGLQPYASSKVLWQFGRHQVILLHSDMSRFEVDFGPLLEIPREMELLREWRNRMTIDVLNEKACCTPEYYVWLLADMEDTGFSRQGQAVGFEDLEETEWTHGILINHFVILPEMWEQAIPGSLAHFGS